MFNFFKKNSNIQETKKINKDLSDFFVDYLEEGIVIYSPDFIIEKINNSAQKIFNLKEKDVVGKKITPELVQDEKFRALGQTIFPSLAPYVDQISTNDWPQIINIKTDSPEMNLVTVLSKVIDDYGNTKKFIKIIQNKTREEGLLESKTEFITTSAHQLRTPLSAISWTFEGIKNSTKEEETKSLASQGLEVAKRGLKIINDLLNVIQIEEGRYGHKPEKIIINNIIEKIAEEAKVIAKKYNIDVSFKAKSKYEVFVDPERISTALSVLVDNAIRYNNENGSVTISLEENNGNALISITDTGIGIPQEETTKIFQKFKRGDKAAQVEPNGSGLGLYISKNIIEKHGGKIWVNSTPGRGTTFSFTLPLK
ncbi:MAG: PAS domain-containing sensor histidine kinase [Candidatus Paceibacterota bacterium]